PEGFERVAARSSTGSAGRVLCRVEGSSVQLRSAAAELSKDNNNNKASHAFAGREPVLQDCADLSACDPGLADVSLTLADQAMLDGEAGRAVQAAMRIVVRMAALQGAREPWFCFKVICFYSSSKKQQKTYIYIFCFDTLNNRKELLSVSQVHIDGCTYIGPAGLRFAQQLVGSA
ncbi:unnamed protein product, partial [Polarella glacialis]